MSETKPNLIQRAAMSLIKMSGTWRPQSIADMERWMDSLISGSGSSSGALVSGDTAVNFAAFFNGVLQICQTIASCDTILYKETGDFARFPWKTHPVYALLTRKPNKLIDSFTWKERMQYYAMVWGNGYSYIQRDAGLRPIGLFLLNPERVKPKIAEDRQSIEYIFRNIDGNDVIYRQDQIFHLRGFGFDGIKGYSLLEIAREIIGLGLSQQDFSGRFLANGTHLGAIVTLKKPLSKDGKKNLRDSIEEYSGTASTGKFIFTEADEMTYTPLGMPLDDAQFLESKIFQIGEIARILNISPYKLKDYSHATFSNIEQLGIEYATDTIRPWAERWESAIETQLLSESEQSRGCVEFDLSAIQRGDFKAQMEGWIVARNGGLYNANEIRYRIGDNPIENKKVGEMYYRSRNYSDASIDEAILSTPAAPSDPVSPEDNPPPAKENNNVSK